MRSFSSSWRKRYQDSPQLSPLWVPSWLKDTASPIVTPPSRASQQLISTGARMPGFYAPTRDNWLGLSQCQSSLCVSGGLRRDCVTAQLSVCPVLLPVPPHPDSDKAHLTTVIHLQLRICYLGSSDRQSTEGACPGSRSKSRPVIVGDGIRTQASWLEGGNLVL